MKLRSMELYGILMLSILIVQRPCVMAREFKLDADAVGFSALRDDIMSLPAGWGTEVAGHMTGTVDATLLVDTAQRGFEIPRTLFGVFFEEINHAGVGGLDAELVRNRGFEAGGTSTPSAIDPWFPVGEYRDVWLATELGSKFPQNPVTLRLEARCASSTGATCQDPVGVANPGYWGMNIESGEEYLVSLWLTANGPLNLTVALRSRNAKWTLGKAQITVTKDVAKAWTRHEVTIKAETTDHEGQLALLTEEKGAVVWLDAVSAKPVKTWKDHGVRVDLGEMLEALKPGVFRFPGGCYVEGVRLNNAFRWRQSVGPWENRPGHLNDVWGYWSDDGLGLFEYLQLAEDLGAEPVWVFNNGNSHTMEVSSDAIGPFVEDILDGIEFARGPVTSEWGKLRADMGHAEPFRLRHMGVGNEDCGKWTYEGNYIRFYEAIKAQYPDMQLITNCDASRFPLVNPADLFDYHIYTNAQDMFFRSHQFDYCDRTGAKVFASEYSVLGKDAGTGNLLAAIGEAGYMVGLERNSDVVAMATYAPLFVNARDRRWNPCAIVFNSWQVYGTPSYWVQYLFSNFRGHSLLPSLVEDPHGATKPQLAVSAVRQHDVENKREVLVVKAVNFGPALRVRLDLLGLSSDSIVADAATVTTLASSGIFDENGFDAPQRVVPTTEPFPTASNSTNVLLLPMSVTIFRIPLGEIPPRSSTKDGPLLSMVTDGRPAAK